MLKKERENFKRSFENVLCYQREENNLTRLHILLAVFHQFSLIDEELNRERIDEEEQTCLIELNPLMMIGEAEEVDAVLRLVEVVVEEEVAADRSVEASLGVEAEVAVAVVVQLVAEAVDVWATVANEVARERCHQKMMSTIEDEEDVIVVRLDMMTPMHTGEMSQDVTTHTMILTMIDEHTILQVLHLLVAIQIDMAVDHLDMSDIMTRLLLALDIPEVHHHLLVLEDVVVRARPNHQILTIMSFAPSFVRSLRLDWVKGI